MAYNRLLFGLIVIIYLLLLFPVSAAAEEDVVAVTGIRLDKTEMRIGINEKTELKATVYPHNASNRRVVWSSSNPGVIDIDASGHTAQLIPRSPGEAVITATTIDRGYLINCFVTVITRVRNIGIDQEVLILAPGEKVELQARVAPRDATEQGIAWHSTDPGVATVSDDGVVEALRIGTVRIIASSVENDRITVYTAITVTRDGTADYIPVTDAGELPPEEPEPGLTFGLVHYIIGGAAALLILALLLFALSRKKRAVQPAFPAQAVLPGHQTVRPQLVGLSGTYAGQVISFRNNQATIGRDPGAQAVYPSENTEVSRRHCTITFDPVSQQFTIVDTSSNGTFWVDGEQLQKNQQYTIEPGERFSLYESNEIFTVELE